MAEGEAVTIPATIDSTSFNCPHCGTLAQQFWWTTRAEGLNRDRAPHVVTEASKATTLERYAAAVKEDEGKIKDVTQWLDLACTGEVIIAEKGGASHSFDITNLFLSRCYGCNRASVWIHDKLVHPPTFEAPEPNPDMPEDVAVYYREAGLIARDSPRGAGALLRLAIQKLMPHVGQKGKNLNNDIGALVAAGLDPRIQKSLDVVRVVGNNLVHPGVISIDDSGETVGTLFKLINVIVESLISRSKHIEAAYAGLPEEARKQIEERDNKGLNSV